MRPRLVIAVALVAAAQLTLPWSASAAPDAATECRRGQCPTVETGNGSLTASYVTQTPEGRWSASNAAPVEHPYTYQLSDPCVVNDRGPYIEPRILDMSRAGSRALGFDGAHIHAFYSTSLPATESSELRISSSS